MTLPDLCQESFDTGQPLDSGLRWHDQSMQVLGLPRSRKWSLQLEGDCEYYEYWKR